MLTNMKQKLYDKGIEKYSLARVIWQNLFFLIYFTIAFIGMSFLQINNIPIASIIYVAFIGIMLIFVLRKHLCTHCFYYGKICNTGWGKLAACLFKKNSGNYKLGGKLASVTWMLAMFLPIIGMVAALILNWFSVTIALLLVVFIILSVVNFSIHKKSCEECKMRFICPGSIAKR